MKICTYLIIKFITENVLFSRHQAVVSRTEQGSFNKKYFHITTGDEYIDFPHTFMWFRGWYFIDPAFSPSEGRPQKIHCAREWPRILTVLVAGGWVAGLGGDTTGGGDGAGARLWSNLRLCCCGQAATLHTSRPRAGHNGQECQDPQSLTSLN